MMSEDIPVILHDQKDVREFIFKQARKMAEVEGQEYNPYHLFAASLSLQIDLMADLIAKTNLFIERIEDFNITTQKLKEMLKDYAANDTSDGD